jgi:hypothetical protein
LQVRILLGSPEILARHFKKPLCSRHFSHIPGEISAQNCPVKRPKVPIDAQREIGKLSSAVTGT